MKKSNQDNQTLSKEQMQKFINDIKENKNLFDIFFPGLNIKSFLGILFIYLIIIFSGVYICFHYFSITKFILYISNVDLLSNTLAISFPDIFKLAYNPNPDSIISYLSYNIISLVALSGTFISGLHMKSLGKSNSIALESMIVVAIVTYTLPTNLIPILTKISEYIMGHYIIDKELHHTFTHALLKFVFALCIAIGFISLEAFILRQHIYTKHLEFNGKRLFKLNPIK